jgi:hypothetical protein
MIMESWAVIRLSRQQFGFCDPAPATSARGAVQP